MTEQRGLIIKGIDGFYYVEAADTVYECRARGIHRKNGIVPTVGDRCTFSVNEGLCMVESIEERKNLLVRPPLANLDKLFIVVSLCDPAPNLLLIDRLTVCAEDKSIEPVIVFTKLDMGDVEEVKSIYDSSGIKTICVDYRSNSGIDLIKREMKDVISGFAGNSGVGKSTLLNAIEPSLNCETGEISKKLGRGRHTTRSSELYNLSFGGKIADTPGFSSFDMNMYDITDKDNLKYCFTEFEEYIHSCKFGSCTHVCEQGCAVIEAVESGKISKSRHNSYCVMFDEAKKKKDWL
ncbi:MAG: ribosome small subunit-dependent GTPase A [Oscillospiraceae bacterium]|jgi:ribosome biogenesis GTPase|nr:ribosome small subunit-dependent GTPase A [Oscillospiraceae bacterium]